jgi:patatin-like phospholipase/acyl hydrolase
MHEPPEAVSANSVCRILSLDGGGAKGFYTLGVLKEIEALVGRPLHENFDLIFGTSTGGIIAALLALGYNVDAIRKLYEQHVPTVMRNSLPAGRSNALSELAQTIFGTRTFTDVKTGIGIVATRWDFEKPMIFKSDIAQAHGRQHTFVPGFGCSIADAVIASCSAYPFFEKHIIKMGDGSDVPVIDGGYCANNPTLYAIADAIKALKKNYSDLRVVSIGVGNYPQPKRRITPNSVWVWCVKRAVGWTALQLLQKTLDINTASMEQLRDILFREIAAVRVNDTYQQPEMATDLLEHDLKKLGTLYQRGRESFAKHEVALRNLLA